MSEQSSGQEPTAGSALRPRLLTAAAVGRLTEYTPRRVRELYRMGRFPAPIDPGLPAYNWRWSPVAIDQYIAGEWKPPS